MAEADEYGVYPQACERCGGKWRSRVEMPVRCSLCKSKYWNRPRMREVGLLKEIRKKPIIKDEPILADGIA